MERMIDRKLYSWTRQKKRKVLLVRGARQVGKTYSARQLGKQFSRFIELNFEENPAICDFFSKSLNPDDILEKISIYSGVKIIPGETLLFLDEIQACPNALKSLRFFHEKKPDLHVLAAGSLLELAIKNIPSFGVGRIQSIYMYPMTFYEFLNATGQRRLVELVKSANFMDGLDQIFHEQLLEQLKKFIVLGGMPEVIDSYISERDFQRCQEILDGLITSLIDDFAKYGEKTDTSKIRQVYESIMVQSGRKFIYSKIGPAKIDSYKTALEFLLKVGLAYKISHTSANGLPLGGQINPKKFKIIPHDTGIFQRLSGLDLSSYIVSNFDTLINKGVIAELYAGLELISNQNSAQRPVLYYWHRESRSSNAELDYTISCNGIILPVEIKSGHKGRMRSIHRFIEEKELNTGIRISQENFFRLGKINNIPLYAIANIFQHNWT